MRATLSHLDEPQAEEDRNDDARSEWWDAPHRSGHVQSLRADECGFQRRLTVLTEHLDDLEQILAKLIQRRALRVRAGPPRHVADEETGVLISFNDRSVGSHRNPKEESFRKVALQIGVRHPSEGYPSGTKIRISGSTARSDGTTLLRVHPRSRTRSGWRAA
jgi:hypothetical protein